MILLLGYIYIYVCVLYTSLSCRCLRICPTLPMKTMLTYIYIYISCGSPLVKNSVLHYVLVAPSLQVVTVRLFELSSVRIYKNQWTTHWNFTARLPTRDADKNWRFAGKHVGLKLITLKILILMWMDIYLCKVVY